MMQLLISYHLVLLMETLEFQNHLMVQLEQYNLELILLSLVLTKTGFMWVKYLIIWIHYGIPKSYRWTRMVYSHSDSPFLDIPLLVVILTLYPLPQLLPHSGTMLIFEMVEQSTTARTLIHLMNKFSKRYTHNFQMLDFSILCWCLWPHGTG